MSIQTVTGEIHKNDLGVVLPHEHIFIDLTVFYTPRIKDGIIQLGDVSIEKIGMLNRDPYALKDNLIIDDYNMQLKEILRFKNAGGGTIVDATTIGIGRNPERLRKISEESGVNVIMGAGYYVGSAQTADMDRINEEDLAVKIADEINIGVDGSGVKAGVIGEIGISEYFSLNECKVLRAAALAQKMTGAGLLIHINPWTTKGLDALAKIEEFNLDPKKICICHVDVENRRDYIMALLDKGVNIEFDNFGKEYYVDKEVRTKGYGLFVKDTQRVEFLKELIDLGYVQQILLSNDVCLKMLLRDYGGWGYIHLLRNIVPMMREFGIDDKAINIMMINNPADFLDIS